MAYHSPERKTEQAFLALFESVAAGLQSGVTFYTRFSNKAIVEPFCSIVCESADPDYVDGGTLGNWAVNVVVVVQSHYERATDATAHDDAVAEISDVLMRSPLADDLNTQGISDFTAVLWRPGTRQNRIEDHSVVTELRGVLHMLPSQ